MSRLLSMLLIGVGVVTFAVGLPGGLWLALIGWFVMSVAAAELAGTERR